MVIPIVTELPLALEPTTRDDFLGSQAAPRPTPVSPRHGRRISRMRILPVDAFGSAPTNRTLRGYL
ncbi:MAG: hypothetical protein QOJ29_470 [Thermoleophilaceae bacterium]|nr:hypothetical protein [Thermoleophilaceae bacterium]